jgi:hypothetical protein
MLSIIAQPMAMCLSVVTRAAPQPLHPSPSASASIGMWEEV